MFKTSYTLLLALLISQTLLSQSTKDAQVQLGGGAATELELARDFSVEIQVSIPAHGNQNILIK